MFKNLTVSRLVKIAMVAAIYAVITVALPLSYGAVQFRVSEILVLLCFYNKDYCASMVVGCIISNLFSPMALLDVPVGTFATLVAVVLIWKSKNLILASIYPVITNGLLVGLELYIAFGEPFFISSLQVAAGEFVVICVVGVVLFKTVLEKNSSFMRLIENKKDIAKAKIS